MGYVNKHRLWASVLNRTKQHGLLWGTYILQVKCSTLSQKPSSWTCWSGWSQPEDRRLCIKYSETLHLALVNGSAAHKNGGSGRLFSQHLLRRYRWMCFESFGCRESYPTVSAAVAQWSTFGSEGIRFLVTVHSAAEDGQTNGCFAHSLIFFFFFTVVMSTVVTWADEVWLGLQQKQGF